MAEDSFLQSAAASGINILNMPISLTQWERLKKTPIESFHWSARAARALEYARCRNLADVFSIPKERWAERRQVGKLTTLEIVNRVQTFLKIKTLIPMRQPCDTTAIKNNLRGNRISGALAEAFGMAGLTSRQVNALQLRCGLAGQPPLTQKASARSMRCSSQRISQLEKSGIGRLSRHPDILPAFQAGLRTIQGRLWRKLAGKNKTIIAKDIATRELNKRAGGPESLLIKVCHGNVKNWLNKSLPSTLKGWRIPV